MKEIPLTQGKVALIDDEDFDPVSQYRWYAVNNRGTTDYACTNVKRDGVWSTTIHMHKLLMGVDPDGRSVDHVDMDGLNNRRSNLRWATRQQQAVNRGPSVVNKSGYRGVHWHTRSKKWRAKIQVERRHISLGLFDDILDAVRAYDEKSRELHGAFARQQLV